VKGAKKKVIHFRRKGGYTLNQHLGKERDEGLDNDSPTLTFNLEVRPDREEGGGLSKDQKKTQKKNTQKKNKKKQTKHAGAA